MATSSSPITFALARPTLTVVWAPGEELRDAHRRPASHIAGASPRASAKQRIRLLGTKSLRIDDPAECRTPVRRPQLPVALSRPAGRPRYGSAVANLAYSRSAHRLVDQNLRRPDNTMIRVPETLTIRPNTGLLTSVTGSLRWVRLNMLLKSDLTSNDKLSRIGKVFRTPTDSLGCQGP